MVPNIRLDGFKFFMIIVHYRSRLMTYLLLGPLPIHSIIPLSHKLVRTLQALFFLTYYDHLTKDYFSNKLYFFSTKRQTFFSHFRTKRQTSNWLFIEFISINNGDSIYTFIIILRVFVVLFFNYNKLLGN